MAVDTVAAVYEMHHQNERIMQMQAATLQSRSFLSSWGAFLFRGGWGCGGVWREYKRSVWWDKVLKSNFSQSICPLCYLKQMTCLFECVNVVFSLTAAALHPSTSQLHRKHQTQQQTSCSAWRLTFVWKITQKLVRWISTDDISFPVLITSTNPTKTIK